MKSSIQFQLTGKCAIPSSVELEQWEFSALAELNIRVHEQMNWSDFPNFDAMATIIPTRYKSGKSKSKPRACLWVTLLTLCYARQSGGTLWEVLES